MLSCLRTVLWLPGPVMVIFMCSRQLCRPIQNITIATLETPVTPQLQPFASRLEPAKAKPPASVTVWPTLSHKKKWTATEDFGGIPIRMPFCLSVTMNRRCLFTAYYTTTHHHLRHTRPRHPCRPMRRATGITAATGSGRHTIMPTTTAAVATDLLLRAAVVCMKITGIPLLGK